MSHSKSIISLAITLGALALLMPTSAFADELSVEVESQSVYAPQSSDVLDSDDYQNTVNLTLGYSADRLSPNLRLLFSYQNTIQDFSDQNRFGSALKTEWHQARFLLGADFGPEFWGFLRPKVRVGLGYSLQDLVVRTTDKALQDYAHDFTAFGAMGVEAQLHFKKYVDPTELPYLSRMSLGIQGLYGYSYQTIAQFDELNVDSDALAEDDPWRREDVDFGSVDNSGMFWSVGFMLSITL